MLKTLIRGLMVAVMAVAMTACGGGGGSDPPKTTTTTSTGTGSTTTTTTTTTPAVSTLIYELDKFTINNSGTEVATLKVTVADANNNPVSGQAIAVSLDSGLYIPTTSTTDAKGQVTGQITIGGNKANRTINATIKAGSLSSKAAVAVTGGSIAMTLVPATPSPGQTVRATMTVSDSTGAPIPNAAITLAGSLGFSGTVTTLTNGTVVATLGAAPAATGTYNVDASALGMTVTRQVTVVSGGSPGIPNAVSLPTAATLQIVPNTVSPNTSGSTTNQVQLRAVYQNASNQAVQNVRTRFEIVAPGLGSGEQVSTGSDIVYSDVNGVAVSQYIPGTRSSPTNGVNIRACYGIDDASIAGGACPNVLNGTLTVAAQPLNVTLGDNNLMTKGAFDLTYIKKFDVAVADSAGNAVGNAVVSASVDLIAYGKGGYSFGHDSTVTPSVAFQYQTTPSAANRLLIPSDTTATGRVWCPNEDTNRNGFLDTTPANEDYNGNGVLEPRKADVILSFVSGNVTGSNGRLTIQVEYAQSVATWIAYTVNVTTNVAGSEGSVSKSYVTQFIEGDDKNGSFLVPPYGVAGCASKN